MKKCMMAILVVVLGCSLTGCMSVKPHSAYREAGNPPERKATLLLGYDLGSVRIDGQKVSLLGRGWGTSAWVVEMLPGQHVVEGVWMGRSRFSGSFQAENQRNYALLTDTSSTQLGGSKHRVSISRAYIAVLPSGKNHELSFGERLGFIQSADQEAKKGYKAVADLRISEEKD